MYSLVKDMFSYFGYRPLFPLRLDIVSMEIQRAFKYIIFCIIDQYSICDVESIFIMFIEIRLETFANPTKLTYSFTSLIDNITNIAWELFRVKSIDCYLSYAELTLNRFTLCFMIDVIRDR